MFQQYDDTAIRIGDTSFQKKHLALELKNYCLKIALPLWPKEEVYFFENPSNLALEQLNTLKNRFLHSINCAIDRKLQFEAQVLTGKFIKL